MSMEFCPEESKWQWSLTWGDVPDAGRNIYGKLE
jgi:hypothetical protein